MQKRGDAAKFVARVVAVAAECDIALLAVEDDAFFEGVEPLTLGPLPRLQARVLCRVFARAPAPPPGRAAPGAAEAAGDAAHGMARAQDGVTVVGFPLGGDTISVTQGVVSRIEARRGAPRSGPETGSCCDRAVTGLSVDPTSWRR